MSTQGSSVNPERKTFRFAQVRIDCTEKMKDSKGEERGKERKRITLKGKGGRKEKAI